MFSGRCCVTGLRLRDALRLDIFIEILLGTSVNRSPMGAPYKIGWVAQACASAWQVYWCSRLTEMWVGESKRRLCLAA
jgi:hypothetical protein